MISESRIIELLMNDALSLDDCAVIPETPGILLISTDSMSEGTHFRLDWSSPEDLALKLIHVNVSDLRSSGAVPSFCFLGLGLPGDVEFEFVSRFAGALRRELAELKIDLLGGDTFRAHNVQLQMTMGGRAARHVRRSGGLAGDSLYLTGTVGLALAGFRHLAGETHAGSLADQAVSRHLRPRAFEIRDLTGVHAAMDVSDGVFADSRRLAAASGVALEIDLDRLPVHPGLSMPPEEAVGSGEELELLFLAPPGFRGFAAAEIGRAVSGAGVKCMRGGRPIDVRHGFSHFDAG